MTVEFALDFIPRRMKELGYQDEYITRWRYLQLEAETTVIIEANNEYFYLINPASGIVVNSKAGAFNLLDTKINEMQYEHKGKITVRTLSGDAKFVLFIQVIPNH